MLIFQPIYSQVVKKIIYYKLIEPYKLNQTPIIIAPTAQYIESTSTPL